ncbi:MAG TPA: primosomal protein N' [Firmicutes bacterium]|nr:primosomal protein N' [Bacillota bacterium]
MIAQVIVDISNSEVDRVFDYAIDDFPDAKEGFRVMVPFGRMNIEGYIVQLKDRTDCPPEKLKKIASVLDPYPVINEELMQVCRFMVDKYHLRMVDVLRLCLPSQMRTGKVKELTIKIAAVSDEYKDKDTSEFIRPSAVAQMEIYNHLLQSGPLPVTELCKEFSASALRNLISRGIVAAKEEGRMRTPYIGDDDDKQPPYELTEQQSAALKKIQSFSNETILLHGVTGSGKTEVYMRCISDVLKDNKTAMMLVPEISLTPQVLRTFRTRFGSNVAILHSGLSAGERFDEWRRILSGDAKVVVGARSAVFAPVRNLGIIIIDEEHDPSYVSESNPRYFTHEVAQERARICGCNLILGSATPSIESYYSAKTGKYKLVEMKTRVNAGPLPKIDIVDMCREVYDGNNGLFSRLLNSKLDECMKKGDQAIIFINRRGYSSYMMCRSCGYVAKCVDCDVSLVYHKDENVLKCHYCGNRYKVLDECPVCHSENIKRGFVGTQQVVELLSQRYPDVGILRMDNDTTQTKDAHLDILSKFRQKKAHILVGTQMIVKGHDFPDVTLVGIVDADMSLHFADFRATERTYQLITQVAGRAGRADKPGEVVLQTYSPRHYVYRYIVNGDYAGFYEKEINLREVTKYPPFSRIVRVLVSCENEQLAHDVLKKIFDRLSGDFKGKRDSIAYFAAMKSPVKRISNKYRVQILVRIVRDEENITRQIYEAVDEYTIPKVSAFVEINPNNLS